MKPLFNILIFLFITPLAAHNLIDTCSRVKMHPRNDNWNGHALCLEEEKCIENALLQPYCYMNAGTHSIAFVSCDGKYVLKFFKKKRFEVPAENVSIPFYTEWRRARRLKKREAAQDRMFSAYRISYDHLSKETGVLYVHFNPNPCLNYHIELADATGQPFSLVLDDWDFILERRAVPLKAHFDMLMEQGDIAGAASAITHLLDLQRILFDKGMRNRDIEFVNNYGFIDGTPVLFDVDRLLPCAGIEGKEKYRKKLHAFLPAFQNWIHAYYPMFRAECDEAIERFMKALYAS